MTSSTPGAVGSLVSRAALAGVVWFACSTVSKADAPDPVIHFKVGHGRFAIPESLFLGGEHPADGGTGEGALLLMTWPGLRGDPGGTPGLQVLIKPLDPGDTADTYLQRKIRTLARPLQNIPKYFDASPLEYGPLTEEAGPGAHGSDIRRITNAHPLPGSWWNEVYVSSPERPDAVIACIPLDSRGLVPSCIEQFATGSLSVQVTYPRVLFGDWQAIRDRLITRVEGFTGRTRDERRHAGGFRRTVESVLRKRSYAIL